MEVRPLALPLTDSLRPEGDVAKRQREDKLARKRLRGHDAPGELLELNLSVTPDGVPPPLEKGRH